MWVLGDSEERVHRVEYNRAHISSSVVRVTMSVEWSVRLSPCQSVRQSLKTQQARTEGLETIELDCSTAKRDTCWHVNGITELV